MENQKYFFVPIFIISSIFFFANLVFFPNRAEALIDGFWQEVGTPGFSAGTAFYTSLAFPEGSSTPYVTYRDDGNSNKATVMKYDGSSWVNVGTPGFSAGPAFYTFLAFPQGSTTPYVVYSDGENSYKATVMKYNGSSWVNVGTPGFSAGTAFYTSLSFPQGSSTPCVVYRDEGNSNKATVMKYDGSSWVNVGTPGFSTGVAGYTSLAFPNGSSIPYVVYQDEGNSYRATVMKYNGNSWVNVGIPGFSAGVSFHTSIAFPEGSSTPYVVYQDDGNSNKATVMKYDGSSWVNVGTPGFSAGTALYTSLAFPQGSTTPYVVYQDDGNSNKATVMKYDGSSWVNVGTPGFSPGVADYTSLSFPQGSTTPYVVYRDEGNSNKATAMKLVSTPIIVYSGTFKEKYADDGSILGSRTASIYSDTFVNSGGTLTEGIHYTFTNKPAGLTSVMTVDSEGETATLTFTGNATSHSSNDSIDDLTITFLDGAFTDTADAEDVENYIDNSGEITFVTHTFDGETTLYGVDGSGSNPDAPHLWILDPDTGEKLTDIGATGANITGLAFHPTTKILYGVSGGNSTHPKSLFTISTTTGEATWLGTLKDGSNTTVNFPDISFRSDGRLYGFESPNMDNLYTIDITSCNGTSDTLCLATPVGETVLSGYGNGLAFDSSDNLYFFGDGDDEYYIIDPDTGEIISNPDFTNPSGESYSLSAAAFDGNDTLFASRLNYGDPPSDLVIIDTETSTLNSLGETTDMQYMDAIAFLLTQAPEEEDPEPSPSPSPSSSGGSSGSRKNTKPTPVVSLPTVTPTPPIIPGCPTGFTCTPISNTTPTIHTNVSPSTFTRNLTLNSTGEDVKQLQKYLNSKGFIVSTTGPGSLNNESTTFGPKTKSALAKFQAANHITPAAGYFGPVTREFINKNR